MAGCAAFLLLELVIYTSEWGVLGLNLYIVGLFYVAGPRRLLHPSMAVFAFYGLWVVVPSTLDLLMSALDWQYESVEGRAYDWGRIGTITLLQIQMSVTTLVVASRFGSGKALPFLTNERSRSELRSRLRAIPPTAPFVVVSLALAGLFMQLTGGIGAWISDYSSNFLLARGGSGALNFVLIAFGTLTTYLLGLKYFANRRLADLLVGGVTIVTLAYMGGFKSRFMVLVFVYISLFLVHIRPNTKLILKYFVAFFVLLYLLTLVRTNGFYSGFDSYIEFTARYFNSYPLHDLVVSSREPTLFATIDQIAVKPGQTLGVVSPSADFDLSVMLTKEYFPDQWYLRNATQQWPIETDMHFNFLGPLLQTVPLGLYGWYLGWFYRKTVIRGNLAVFPLFLLEFIRVFSVLRGTLLPWQLPVFILQYLSIYVIASHFLSRVSSTHTLDALEQPAVS